MGKYFSKIVHSRLAIRKDAAEMLAQSSVDGKIWQKPDGEWNVKANVTYRPDNIAVIHVDGALSYRSDFWAAIFGNDTYNSIEAAFDECCGNPNVLGIVFDIDSPGGEVSGVSDLAEKIYNARGSKPYGIVARAGGMMCSAAYWLGSACEKIYTAAAGTLGSIGVLCSFMKQDDSALETIVSDLSPNKNPSPDNAEGLSLIKKELNDLASVFIAAVAKHRSTDFQTVLTEFGQGGVFIGQKAVDAKLADEVLSLDEVFEQMKLNHNGGIMPNTQAQAEHPMEITAEMKAAVLAEERERISGIAAAFAGLSIDAAEREKFVAEGKTVAEAKDFAFDKCKAELEDVKKQLAEKDEKIKALENAKPDNSAVEKVKQMLEKNSEASASVEGGAHAEEESAKKDAAIEAAFLAGMNQE